MELKFRMILVLVSLLLFTGCYTYKNRAGNQGAYIVGEKYEIRIGSRKLEKVTITSVTDSTITVLQGRNEITIQKALITESKQRTFSTGKTIIGISVGILLTIITLGVGSLAT